MASSAQIPNQCPPAEAIGRPGATRTAGVAAVLVGVTAAAAALRCLKGKAGLARRAGELAVLARTDPLTGLHNRRHVEEHLAAALSAARRHRHPLSILFIDIDNFKAVNDRSGYEVGDAVLRAVGGRVRVALRAEDFLGRWGGEEFLAVLPMTDPAGALAVAERVRAAVATDPVHRGTRVTVSIGSASGGHDPADAVRRASRALQEAKRAGKNRVVAADHTAD
jgi:two-component system, cell cycle response regulator